MKKISTNTILNYLGWSSRDFKEKMGSNIEDFIKTDKVEHYIAKGIDSIFKN